MLIYSTESIYPIAVIGNIHYASINDMAWDTNKKLVICSTDGYCSIVNFESGTKEGESNIIGERLSNDEVPEKLRAHYEVLD